MTISVPLNLNAALISPGEVANGDGSVTAGNLNLFDSSDDLYPGSLAYTGVDSRIDGAIADATGTTLATLASGELTGVYLAAGSKLTFTFSYSPGDLTKNNAAFVILEGTDHSEQIDLIANTALIQKDGEQIFSNTLSVDLTDTYKVIFVNGDAAGVGYGSFLQIQGVTLDLPNSSAVVNNAISLGNGYSIGTNGALLQNGAVIDPSYASGGAAGNIASVAAVIKQYGGGVISNDGGSVISNDGGSLVGPSGGTLIADDGAAVISNDGGSLVGPSGGTIIGENSSGLISQDGNGLISQDGNGLIGQDGNGLISQDGNGLISQDGNGLINQDGNGLVPAPPREFTLATVTLPPAASATMPPTFTAGTDAFVTSTFSYQLAYTPKVATLSNGTYVVVWEDDGGSYHGEVLAQIYNADGSKAGAQFVASRGDATSAGQPTVAAMASGGFVIGWSELSSTPTGYLSSIHAQIFRPDGTPFGGTIAISPANGEGQFMPSFAPLAGDGFIAVWGVNSNNVSNTSPAAQMYDGSGALLATPQLPLPTGTGIYSYYQSSVVTGLSHGGSAIAFVYLNQGNGPDTYATYVDLFDSHGVVTAGPIKISPDGEGVQVLPAIATLTNGDVVVAWLDEGTRTNSQQVGTLRMQIVDPTGALVGSTITVAQAGTDDPPSITALANGGFAVGWDAYTYSGNDNSNPSSKDVKVQLFNADGSSVGTPLFANAADSFAVSPGLATLPNQTVVVASVQGDFSVHTKDFSVTTPPAAKAPANGVGEDGYISGATVFADAAGTGVYGAGDASTTTDAQGHFTLPAGSAGVLYLSGGTDTSTGLAFTQTYSAPAGSTSITALTTLVQRLMAAGADLGTAEAEVSAAFSLSALTDLTTLDPIASVAANQGNGLYALLAGAVVADTLSLAKAAGASGDLFGKLAAELAARPFQTLDPTSVAAIEGLGLSGQAAIDTSTMAGASRDALVKAIETDTNTIGKLPTDVAQAEASAQSTAAVSPTLPVTPVTTTPVTTTPVTTTPITPVTVAPGSSTQATVGPVYRFFDTTTGTHFFTADAGERDNVLANVHNLVEETNGYGDVAQSAPNSEAVYRFFDTIHGTHFFTASSAERDSAIATRSDLTYEASSTFYENTAAVAGDVAVYRFFDNKFGTHFYTGDQNEFNALTTPGSTTYRTDLTYEGISFYAPAGSFK